MTWKHTRPSHTRRYSSRLYRMTLRQRVYVFNAYFVDLWDDPWMSPMLTLWTYETTPECHQCLLCELMRRPLNVINAYFVDLWDDPWMSSMLTLWTYETTPECHQCLFCGLMRRPLNVINAYFVDLWDDPWMSSMLTLWTYEMTPECHQCSPQSCPAPPPHWPDGRLGRGRAALEHRYPRDTARPPGATLDRSSCTWARSWGCRMHAPVGCTSCSLCERRSCSDNCKM